MFCAADARRIRMVIAKPQVTYALLMAWSGNPPARDKQAAEKRFQPVVLIPQSREKNPRSCSFNELRRSFLRCHENGSAGILPATSSTARCPATAGRMPALPGFSCTVVSRRITKSSLRTAGGSQDDSAKGFSAACKAAATCSSRWFSVADGGRPGRRMETENKSKGKAQKAKGKAKAETSQKAKGKRQSRSG